MAPPVGRRLRTPLLVAFALALPIVLLYGQVLLSGKTLVPYDALVADPAFRPLLEARGISVPQNGLLADLVFQNVVWKTFLRDVYAQGQVPLWNPLILGGLPFFAAGQSSPLYPLTALFLFLPVNLAFAPNAALNLWLAALAMYALGRALRLGRGPSAIMAVCWSLSTLFVANTVFPMIQSGMAWTPAALAAIETLGRIAESRRPGVLPRGRAVLWLVALAAATAMVGLSGHPEMLYYALLTTGAYGLFRLVEIGGRRGFVAAARFGGWAAVGIVAGLLVAAVQLVPMAELAATNFRASATYADAISHAFGLRQAITFFVPNFYGNPADHAFWDVTRRAVSGARPDAMWGGAVGAKNYVESAAYLGILPLLLAAVGLVGSRRRERWFFAGLAALAVSFVFGLPTYRVLFALPGIAQLRTPFRWVFPLLLALTVLAGLGADRLTWRRPSRVAGVLATLALALGGIGAGVLAASYAQPVRWISAVERSFSRLPGAADAILDRFGDWADFGGYVYLEAAHFVVFLCLAGIAIALLQRSRGRGATVWLLAACVAAADLLFIGRGFNPAVDAGLADVRPPAVAVLQDAVEAKWGRVVGLGDDKVLWPNTLMRYGVPDLRGYDSIIPHWTADSITAAAGSTNWLRYNRIGNLSDAASLHEPLLRAAAARYVVTTRDLDEPDLVQLYDGDVKVYENADAMPRAWIAKETRVVTDTAALAAELDKFSPADTVILDEAPSEELWLRLPPGRPLSGPPASVLSEKPNELRFDVYAPSAGMLVDSDAYFPGWRAYIETVGALGKRSRVEVPVFRADGMLRAVPVPAGYSTVVLSYFPMSLKVGIFGSFLGLLLLFLALAYGAWSRFVRVDEHDQLGRIAVNSVGPMGAALLNKAVDFAFAMLMLRILGPENAGKYYTAITVIAFAEIFTNFGLNLFTTRELARRPDEAPTYVTQTSLLRLALWIVALPGLGVYVLYRASAGSPLAPDTVAAVALLALALIPGNLNTALTSVFQAFEQMMLPAGVTIVSNFVRVALGAGVLLAGFGFVGLAGVAIVVNWLTFGILAVLLVRGGVRPQVAWRPQLARSMAGTSFPFMLNHLLQTVFFKVDVLLLSQMKGDAVVGWYSAAYKWIDALLIIPGYFTMALFPMMSRRAADDRTGLRTAYVLSLRWLLALALPIAMATTLLSEDLIRILAGPEYLPAGAIALSIMIWFLPLSFVNGLTQYVLLAMDRQRWITPSFAVAVAFNVVANLWAIPRYGYQGAAVVTIISEMALLVPFWWGVRDLGAPALPAIAWRPALAASLMGAVMVALDTAGFPPWASTAVGAVLYLAALRVVGGVTEEDRSIVRRLLRRSDAA